jgi:hypothetical protein
VNNINNQSFFKLPKNRSTTASSNQLGLFSTVEKNTDSFDESYDSKLETF